MEIEGLDSNSPHNIAKGKRTKRMKLLSPCNIATTTAVVAATTVMMTSSCSSANSGGSSTTTYESEEEDMANCLILLAQGGESDLRHEKQQVDDNCDGVKTEKGNRNSSSATTAVNSKAGFYIYECKTCNRTFPSFQALGGHRASHKRPKLVAEEKKPPPSELPHLIITNYDGIEEAHVKSGAPISLQLGSNNNKGKIHGCSICGSEFTSGQALGGHMRRHRASTNNTNAADTTSCNTVVTTTTTTAQPPRRNILQLDLNLPAPEDDLREAKFQFTAALVDCHY